MCVHICLSIHMLVLFIHRADLVKVRELASHPRTEHIYCHFEITLLHLSVFFEDRMQVIKNTWCAICLICAATYFGYGALTSRSSNDLNEVQYFQTLYVERGEDPNGIYMEFASKPPISIKCGARQQPGVFSYEVTFLWKYILALFSGFKLLRFFYCRCTKSNSKNFIRFKSAAWCTQKWLQFSALQGKNCCGKSGRYL